MAFDAASSYDFPKPALLLVGYLALRLAFVTGVVDVRLQFDRLNLPLSPPSTICAIFWVVIVS